MTGYHVLGAAVAVRTKMPPAAISKVASPVAAPFAQTPLKVLPAIVQPLPQTALPKSTPVVSKTVSPKSPAASPGPDRDARVARARQKLAASASKFSTSATRLKERVRAKSTRGRAAGSVKARADRVASRLTSASARLLSLSRQSAKMPRRGVPGFHGVVLGDEVSDAAEVLRQAEQAYAEATEAAQQIKDDLTATRAAWDAIDATTDPVGWDAAQDEYRGALDAATALIFSDTSLADAKAALDDARALVAALKDQPPPPPAPDSSPPPPNSGPPSPPDAGPPSSGEGGASSDDYSPPAGGGGDPTDPSGMYADPEADAAFEAALAEAYEAEASGDVMEEEMMEPEGDEMMNGYTILGTTVGAGFDIMSFFTGFLKDEKKPDVGASQQAQMHQLQLLQAQQEAQRAREAAARANTTAWVAGTLAGAAGLAALVWKVAR